SSYLVARRVVDFFSASAWEWAGICKGMLPAQQPPDRSYSITDNTDLPETEFVLEDFKLCPEELSFLIGEPLENRGEQNEYIKRISESFNGNLSMMIEAGTGTGKTIGYLLPGVKWALENKKTLIVSTKTKTLQQQILEKDIPVVKGLLDRHDLKVVKVQGRNNYLCIRKMERMLADIDLWDDFESKYARLFYYSLDKLSDIADVTAIPSWLKRDNATITGMLNVVCADAASCMQSRCINYNECHYFRMIRSALQAQVLIVNHSLVMNWPVHLQKGERIIFDEAHNLEREATSASTLSVGTESLDGLLNTLYEPEHGRGILFMLKKQNIEIPSPGYITALIDTVREDEIQIQSYAKDLFYSVLNSVGKKPGNEWSEDLIVFSPAMSSGMYDLMKFGEWKVFADSLVDLGVNLKKISEYITELDRNSLENTEYPLLLLSLQEKIDEQVLFLNDLAALSARDLNADKFVYWVSWHDGKFLWSVSRAFIDVGAVLAENVYGDYLSSIFTSATLNAGKISLAPNIGFDHIEGRIYSDQTVTVDSPFDYKNNSALCFLNNTCAPWERNFIADLSGFIKSIADMLGGKTLILFSSLKRMNACYSTLVESMEPEGYKILKQGHGGDIVDYFVSEPKAVLLGSESFGEGLDIRGEDLSCVILERMPVVIKDPVYIAREELYKSRTGKSPYTGFELPQRLLKLRQWSGRLIRSKTDKGVVIVYDNWFSRQNDGIKKIVAEAMQPMPVAVSSQREMLNWIRKRYEDWGYL
ncbi:MAG: ATP-dependent DNA helicase, partial [Oligoflexia bacterium]|nr:ATP-dependent DNA helicase [Oligoflexia bacterium]